jgi:putative endonuclease
MHVEAFGDRPFGRGFDSRRLHSTRPVLTNGARSWQALSQTRPAIRGESNALSEARRAESKGRHWQAVSQTLRNVVRRLIVVVPVPFVYVLRCADHSLYIGHTHDLNARLAAHHDGTAALFTRRRRPVSIAYSERHSTVLSAIMRERQIKRWTRAKKEALITGDRLLLKRL